MIAAAATRRRTALLAALALLLGAALGGGILGGGTVPAAQAAPPHSPTPHSPPPQHGPGGQHSPAQHPPAAQTTSAAPSPDTTPQSSPVPAGSFMTPSDIAEVLRLHYVRKVACVTDNDTGSTLRDGISWAQRQLNYPALWSLGHSGAGQRVAVIDTGVNDVRALSGRLVGAGDYVVPDDNGTQDCDGHGTLVAGLIAGEYDSTTGFAGVAPEATIYSIRQSSENYGVRDAPSGSLNATAGTTITLAAAIKLATRAQVSVINISEASCASGGADGVQAAVAAAVHAGIVIVAAAGNVDDSSTCRRQNTPGQAPVTVPVPASTPGVLAVGAIDEQGAPASFSLAGSWVGVAAPGVDIVAPNPVPGSTGQINELSLQSGSGPVQGTSFAAPYVSGLVALVRARFPSLSPAQVVERIEATAQHPAAPNGPAGWPRNDYVGYGVIDPLAALTAVVPGLPDNPSVVTHHGPSVLPAASAHPDPERHARQIALVGVLAVVLAVLAGLVANSARRRRAEVDAQRPEGLRSAGGGGRRR